MAGLVWVANDFGWEVGSLLRTVTWGVTIFAGVTMVSNMPFYSFKDINFKKRVPFWVILALVAGLSVVSWRPSAVLFLAAIRITSYNVCYTKLLRAVSATSSSSQ